MDLKTVSIDKSKESEVVNIKNSNVSNLGSLVTERDENNLETRLIKEYK